MGYDFAMTVGDDESEATPLCRGRDRKKRHSGKTAADIGSKGLLSRYSILHSCKGGMNAMKKTELKELYQMMFPNYPDIVTVKQLQVMLGVSRHLAYKLINDGEIQAVKIGTSLKIPKVSVINFVTEERREVKPGA